MKFRGYRQNFETAGFPGIDKEFAEIDEFFTPTTNATIGSNENRTVLDLSCGSGFMTRRLAKSKKFSRVIAADLSPSMLMETKRRSKEVT